MPSRLTTLKTLVFVATAIGFGCAWAIDPSEFESDLQERIPKWLERYSVPGVGVGLVASNQIAFSNAFGVADTERSVPNTTTTVFNVGSVSKTLAAWVAMTLTEKGVMQLDAPIQAYIHRWSLPESEWDHTNVTLRSLLSHTAGVSLVGYPGFGQPSMQLPTLEESLSGDTNGAGAVYVRHAPLKTFKYSGGGYTLTQLAVEELSGQTFTQYARDSVLQPLGMTSSSFDWDELPVNVKASPHAGDGSVVPHRRFTAVAAAGFATSIEDLTRFVAANLNATIRGNVLTEHTLKSMWVPGDAHKSYGLGYEIEIFGGYTIYGHVGSNAGWKAAFYVVPESGDGIAVVTNGSKGASVHREITCAWKRLVTGTSCNRMRLFMERQIEKLLD